MNKTERMSAAQYREYIRGGAADTERSLRAGNSSERGRVFESLLLEGCKIYAQNGKAIVSKVHEPYICMKNLDGGGFVGKFTGRAEPDFKGVLKGGQAIAFEAKSTGKSRICRNVLTMEQMQWLDAQMMMGARTFVCVNMTDEKQRERFFTIPWHVWHDMEIDYGRKYLTAVDIPEYEVKFDGAVRFLEYVNGEVISG